MKERPILFTSAMVLALLAGTKTQTRRPLYVMTKNAGTACFDQRYPPSYGGGKWPNVPVGSAWTISQWRKAQPGDLLWVREAWRAVKEADALPPRDLTPAHRIWYEAQEEVPFHPSEVGKLRPSIFMPRWASRITREVVSVRVERLQDISEADAIAEGVHPDQYARHGDDAAGFHRIGAVRGNSFPIARYAALWESINGPGSWDQNPWVVDIQFKPLEKS